MGKLDFFPQFCLIIILLFFVNQRLDSSFFASFLCSKTVFRQIWWLVVSFYEFYRRFWAAPEAAWRCRRILGCMLLPSLSSLNWMLLVLGLGSLSQHQLLLGGYGGDEDTFAFPVSVGGGGGVEHMAPNGSLLRSSFWVLSICFLFLCCIRKAPVFIGTIGHYSCRYWFSFRM